MVCREVERVGAASWREKKDCSCLGVSGVAGVVWRGELWLDVECTTVPGTWERAVRSDVSASREFVVREHLGSGEVTNDMRRFVVDPAFTSKSLLFPQKNTMQN